MRPLLHRRLEAQHGGWLSESLGLNQKLETSSAISSVLGEGKGWRLELLSITATTHSPHGESSAAIDKDALLTWLRDHVILAPRTHLGRRKPASKVAL